MIGMAVTQQDDVDVFRPEARRSKLCREPSSIRARHKSVRAIASIDQDEFLARVDDGGRKSRLVFSFGQKVGAHQLLNIGFVGVGADERKRAVDEGFRIGNRRQLEGTELEPEELGLPCAEARCRRVRMCAKSKRHSRYGSQSKGCLKKPSEIDMRR